MQDTLGCIRRQPLLRPAPGQAASVTCSIGISRTCSMATLSHLRVACPLQALVHLGHQQRRPRALLKMEQGPHERAPEMAVGARRSRSCGSRIFWETGGTRWATMSELIGRGEAQPAVASWMWSFRSLGEAAIPSASTSSCQAGVSLVATMTSRWSKATCAGLSGSTAGTRGRTQPGSAESLSRRVAGIVVIRVICTSSV